MMTAVRTGTPFGSQNSVLKSIQAVLVTGVEALVSLTPARVLAPSFRFSGLFIESQRSIRLGRCGLPTELFLAMVFDDSRSCLPKARLPFVVILDSLRSTMSSILCALSSSERDIAAGYFELFVGALFLVLARSHGA